MASVTYKNAQRLYPGTSHPAVDDLNLEINDGEFMVLVGPSGCGKSTSLRMLAGLEEVTGGHIFIGDRDVSQLPPKDRDIAMVFQNYALYPHMDVGENMAFSLKIAKVSKEERVERVRRAARLLDLEDYLERKPKALSGGQRQRVAIARALVTNPSILLADEPTGNLDSQTSIEILALFDELHSDGQTIIVVTHEPDVAAHGQRIVRLKDGKIVEDQRNERQRVSH